MPVFADASEAEKYLSEIFVVAMANPELWPKINKAGLHMRVEYSDPSFVMLVDMKEGKVYTGLEADGMDWEVALAMKSDDGHRFWLGKLNFTVAMTKGLIRTKGSITELLKLLPLAKKLFATYRELLEKDGRTDLVDAAR